MLLNQFSSADPILELMGSCMSICEVKMVSLDLMVKMVRLDLV